MSSVIRHPTRGEGLGDILERVLDKGVVVAGDVSVSLVGIELLTIRIRLIVASVDKAVEMGINWWETDPTLNGDAQPRAVEGQAVAPAIAAPSDGRIAELETENRELRGRLALIERRLMAVEG
ncbi:MAG: gas vesicle protein [Parvularculaceae bacterium]